jgi:hypothetical protein
MLLRVVPHQKSDAVLGVGSQEMLKETAIFVGAGKLHAYIERRFASNVGVRFPCWLVRRKSYFFG